jgi:hypothetical protein
MNEYRFTAEVARQTRPVNAEALWRIAPAALAERAYKTDFGIVLVRADWTPLASDEDIVRIDVHVLDESERLAPRDVPAFVELSFHDVFLLFNIAVPGSFGGAITVTGGEYRVNDLSFDVAPFVGAASTIVPLADVVSWSPGGTEQIASTSMQKVLFHLLHIARGGSDEWMLRVRLHECLTALGIGEPPLDVAGAAVIHPMHDEMLDGRLNDEAMEIIDRAIGRVLTAIQEAVRAR